MKKNIKRIRAHKTGSGTKMYHNETVRLLIERGSCRSFIEKPLEPELMSAMLEAGIHSPTGGNLQPYSIIKIEKAKRKAMLAKLCGQPFMARASAHLVFCIDFHRLRRWAKLETAPFVENYAFRHFWISFQDTIICAQNICTAADSLGLGSVYIGPVADNIPQLRKIFRLPKGVIPVVLLAVGYPAAKPVSKNKLGPEIIVHDDVYRDIPDSRLRAAFDAKYANAKYDVTKENLAEIEGVCAKVHGKKFAAACRAQMRKQGYINTAQRTFGLHYKADEMLQTTEALLRAMEEGGLYCFRKLKRKYVKP
jgi:FMN reductase [NAD(P)H]